MYVHFFSVKMAMPASEPESSPKYKQHVKLKNSLAAALGKFCQDNMVFADFVHVTGRVSFNVDNREVNTEKIFMHACACFGGITV